MGAFKFGFVTTTLLAGAATLLLSEFLMGSPGRARLHLHGDLNLSHRRRADRWQSGVQVRTDACGAHGQQHSGRGAVGPPLLAAKLRGRMARAVLLAGRARRADCSVQGAHGALARPHPAPAGMVNLECLGAREARAPGVLGSSTGWGGLLQLLREEPLLAFVGGLHAVLVCWKCCNFLRVRAGWYRDKLWPDDSLVAHRTGGMRGAKGVKTRSSGLVPFVVGGMYSFLCLVRAYVFSMLLQSGVRLWVACGCSCACLCGWLSMCMCMSRGQRCLSQC